MANRCDCLSRLDAVWLADRPIRWLVQISLSAQMLVGQLGSSPGLTNTNNSVRAQRQMKYLLTVLHTGSNPICPRQPHKHLGTQRDELRELSMRPSAGLNFFSFGQIQDQGADLETQSHSITW